MANIKSRSDQDNSGSLCRLKRFWSTRRECKGSHLEECNSFGSFLITLFLRSGFRTHRYSTSPTARSRRSEGSSTILRRVSRFASPFYNRNLSMIPPQTLVKGSLWPMYREDVWVELAIQRRARESSFNPTNPEGADNFSVSLEQ